MLYSVICALTTLCCLVEATVDITITKYGMCGDHKDTPMQHWLTFNKINSSVSLATGKSILPYPLGDDTKVDSTIEIFREDTWKVLHELKDEPLCQHLEKYGGDMWHAAQEYIHIEKGTCPIPKGTYELKDYVVNLDLLPIKSGPKALMRSRGTLTRKNELVLCVETEFESA